MGPAFVLADDPIVGRFDDADLRLLDDVRFRLVCPIIDPMEEMPPGVDGDVNGVSSEERDPDVLRTALARATAERRRAECLGKMQTDVVKLALDLLVREPDIEGFFGALTRTMVEEGDSHACAVWLIDEERQQCDLWMTYVVDRLFTRSTGDWCALGFPREVMGGHLMAYRPGWTETVQYVANDSRLPEPVREF